MSKAELTGRIDNDINSLSINLELLGSDLQRNRVDSLAHFCPAVANFDTAITAESDDCPTDFPEPVPEPGILHADCKADGAAGGTCVVIVRLDHIETLSGSPGTFVHDLSWAPDVTRQDDVLAPKFPSVDAGEFCKTVDHTLGRKLCLVRTESSECSAHGIIRAHSDRLNIE